MSEKILLEASFNPKVKTYFLVNAVLLSALFVFSIPLIPIIAIIVWIIADKQLKAMSARLLERKLVVKKGIWFVVEKSIPLEKITDVAMSQGPLMRMFDLYALSFETAGATADGALVRLVGIEDAANFRESILAQKDNLLNKQESEQSSAQPSSSSSAPVLNTANDETIQNLTKSVQNIEKLLEELLAKK